MFEYFAESLASEIQNSLDYYSGQFASRFGSQLYIYGDLAYSDDLIELLDNRFELEFRAFSRRAAEIPQKPPRRDRNAARRLLVPSSPPRSTPP